MSEVMDATLPGQAVLLIGVGVALLAIVGELSPMIVEVIGVMLIAAGVSPIVYRAVDSLLEVFSK